MRNPGSFVLQAGRQGRAVLSLALLVLALNAAVAGVSAVVPPGAPDIVEPQPTQTPFTQASFTQPAPAHGYSVVGDSFSVPLPAWTVIGLVMIGAVVVAFFLLRRPDEYVPRSKRLRK
ncbi:MAG TPA: hypothetical protein PK445_06405 [Methanolinea sp.]|jgi:disulfide bond formation protein DsbB|nr:hypothetical protein [Methanolinea sp.]HPC55606.1 hypothetical protein [Methanolinea sp.]HQE85746.1 hypothetical protein [Methanolinea sp.]HQI14548.1 hypothetical protein [Methanolinea sp.]HQJ19013.1 hypothetical protein [Methanolinea sp.]